MRALALIFALCLLSGCSEYKETQRCVTTGTISGWFSSDEVTCIVIIEMNEDGKERAHIKTATRRFTIDSDIAKAMIEEVEREAAK